MAEGLTPKEIDRLREAAKENYLLGAKSRALRAELIKVFAGTLYPDLKTDGLSDYVNLMRDSAQAKVYSMAANRPRAMVRTFDPSLKAWAKKKGRALDAVAKRQRLERVYQRAAMDAFFAFGTIKTAMIQAPMIQQPFATAGRAGMVDVSYDHFCWDMEATDFDYCSFKADRYQVRMSDVLENKNYPAKLRDLVSKRGSESTYSTQTNDWAESIASAQSSEIARFEDWIYQADFFIPSRQCIYSFVVDDEFQIIGDQPLSHMKWEGKPTGPYSFLTFGRVPGNTKPSSPAQALLKQHNLINTSYRKLEEQIEHQKTVFLGATGNEEDTMRIRDAKDLQIISSSSGQKLESHNFPGPDQSIFAMLMHLLEQYSKRSGNLDNKLGTGPSADTAKQEGMISAAVNAMEAADNAQFIAMVRETMVDLDGLLWRDAATHVPMVLEVPGAGVSVVDDWFPSSIQGSRKGNLEDYDVDIDPYSLAYKPPSQLADESRALWNEMLPFHEQMAMDGVRPSWRNYLDIQSRYRNSPEIREMFEFGQPMPPRGEADPSRGGGKKPGGPREYIHRSAGPQGGSAPKGDQIMQMMSAGNRDNRNHSTAGAA
jgi:hypothetical protein